MNFASPVRFLLFPSKPHFLFSRPATVWPTGSPVVGGERRLFKKANAKQV
jgi:hypothetical protein